MPRPARPPSQSAAFHANVPSSKLTTDAIAFLPFFLLGFVLSESGYHKMLQKSENEDDQERLANIEELLTVARDFDERRDGAGPDPPRLIANRLWHSVPGAVTVRE